jgi:hypothetical protein
MKNIIASIQAKLRQLAQVDGKNYQLILIRYFQERLILLENTVYTEGSPFDHFKKTKCQIFDESKPNLVLKSKFARP